LQNSKQKFSERGIALAAVSYDSEAILRDFSTRHGIAFPLLADPDSQIISEYGVLDDGAKGFTKGMAHPGYFYVTPDGKVSEEFFESAYTDRYTGNNIILKLFPDLVEGSGRQVAAPHFGLSLSQSDRLVIPGSRITVAAEITLPSGTHVYAPGVSGYKPIQLVLDPSPDLKLSDVRYPKPVTLYLPAIKESVPVFEGRFQIRQDVVVSSDGAFVKSIGGGKKVTLKGILKYQACDKTKCFLPQEVELSWDIQVGALDLERAPAAIQHK
jgi:hypothetical protein